EEIQLLLRNINWRVEKLKIKADFLDRRFRSAMFIRQMISSVLVLIIGLPIFVVGFIHNIVPYKLTDLLMPRLVKNVEYYAPVAILMGLVLYPLNYAGFLFLINYLFEFPLWAKLVYFFGMPLSGLYAFYFARYFGHISYKLNYVFLVMSRRGALIELQTQRKRLFDMIFN